MIEDEEDTTKSRLIAVVLRKRMAKIEITITH